MQYIFWFDLFLLFFPLAGFPAILFILASIKKPRFEKEDILPSVSVVVAAYNEEKVIREKIENTLSLDYPRDKLELIIGSDASTDSTENIVEEYRDMGVVLKRFKRRSGKIKILNISVPEASGEIVVLTDANIILAKDAVKKIVRGFVDEKVGAICGNQKQRIYSEKSLEGGESTYWEYDKKMKIWEMSLGTIVSADGSFYAIRKNIFRTIPEGVMDDLAVSQAIVRQGYRILFDEEALAYEDAITKSAQEFGRRVRIVQMSLRGLWINKSLLNPFKYGFYSFMLFSHKVLRRLVPLFILFLFPLNVLLLGDGSVYFFLFLLQILIYLAGIIAFVMEKNGLPPGRLKIPYYFITGITGTLVGFMLFISGREKREWERARQE